MTWGPSIRHDGKGCRLPNGTRVRAVFEYDPNEFTGEVEGFVGEGSGLSWEWRNWRRIGPDGYRIARVVRYRVWIDGKPVQALERAGEHCDV
jgi:hypothetical protein